MEKFAWMGQVLATCDYSKFIRKCLSLSTFNVLIFITFISSKVSSPATLCSFGKQQLLRKHEPTRGSLRDESSLKIEADLVANHVIHPLWLQSEYVLDLLYLLPCYIVLVFGFPSGLVLMMTVELNSPAFLSLLLFFGPCHHVPVKPLVARSTRFSIVGTYLPCLEPDEPFCFQQGIVRCDRQSKGTCTRHVWIQLKTPIYSMY